MSDWVTISSSESLSGRSLLLRRESEKSCSGKKCMKTCSGEECIKFLEDIVYASNDAHSSHYPPLAGNSTGLRSILCRQGSPTCDLEYEDDPSIKFLVGDANLDTKASGEANWLEIAKKTGTDKVEHGYAHMYQEYLGPLSRADVDPFVFVEMGYLGGMSAKAWRKFLPKADVHEMEVSCDFKVLQNLNRSKWEHRLLNKSGEKGIHLHCGDAREQDFIDESLQNYSSPLVFVDDGGHGPLDMIKPFYNVFPKLQDGGYYFVEDLAQAWKNEVHAPYPEHFPEQVLKKIVRDLMAPAGAVRQLNISAQIEHVKCRFQICALVKTGGQQHQKVSRI